MGGSKSKNMSRMSNDQHFLKWARGNYRVRLLLISFTHGMQIFGFVISRNKHQLSSIAMIFGKTCSDINLEWFLFYCNKISHFIKNWIKKSVFL